MLEAAALKEDLHTLISGDMTEIGERGINLSGGQKQVCCVACSIDSRVHVAPRLISFHRARNPLLHP